MPTKIFVGNVNPTTKAEQLRVLFEKFGKVTECDIIRNYAFVHMEYDTEAVQAIRQLNGYSVCNSRIRVEVDSLCNVGTSDYSVSADLMSHGKKTENADKKPLDRAFPSRKPLGQAGLTNFNSRFTPGSFNNNNNNWSDNYEQRSRFRENFPDYYERDGRMPSVPDRFPTGPMSDRMGSMQDRYSSQGPQRDRMMPPPHSERFPSSQPERMRPSSPFDRRAPPPPPHTMRENYYMDRDPYYRERSPISRMPTDCYDRNMKRDYPPSPYQNNDNMGGFKRDAPMGRDMSMRSMGMDTPGRDQMPSSRGGMEPMRRENMAGNRGPGPMGGGRDSYRQGDSQDHHNMGNRQMSSMMRDRQEMGGGGGGSSGGMNNSGGYSNYNGQQQGGGGGGGGGSGGGGGGGYGMNHSYNSFNNDRSRSGPGMDSSNYRENSYRENNYRENNYRGDNYRDNYQGMGGGGGGGGGGGNMGSGGGGGRQQMGSQKKGNLPDQSFLQTGPIFF